MKQQRKSKENIKSQESLFYKVEVRDKEGRVLKRVSGPSRSYVQQWNQLIAAHAKYTSPGGPTITVKDTSGANLGGYSSTATLMADAPIGQVAWGIRVGKGSTAVAITDYALEQPLGEGTGVEQLEHQLTQWTAPSVLGSTSSFTLKRTMVNNSGATITGVREIGCYIRFQAGMLSRFALGFRDVLPSPLAIPDGGAITVTYTLKVTA